MGGGWVRGESVFSQILTTRLRPRQGENAIDNPGKPNFEKKGLIKPQILLDCSSLF
jgi:hypothetical protein